eukprot:TRINITY_DN23788_c0_g1_i3.p1 TRINITY_DN23788_c0_g1~~TRINITY_DN23788_c0_g1_i3.p1  ORF type:complete len:172 (+),score=34.39 TRINITY_DN23788_c0_g1_i3:114-629(+)
MSQMDPTTRLYTDEKTALVSGEYGRVYLDIEKERVCIKGREDRRAPDLGYELLPKEEIFPFYELRSAAVDLRGAGFSRMGVYEAEPMRSRIEAQLETLIEKKVRYVVLSAFGCGAFLNPAEEVAKLYHAELAKRLEHFDCVVFAIFHAGYGPDNFTPFKEGLKDLITEGTS